MAVSINSILTPVRRSPLIGNWTPAMFKPKNRSIGGIVAEGTIEETGTDDIQITEHPVEQGSPIADHAFKRPCTINIRAGWSTAGSFDLSETGVYGRLLSWQVMFLPFDVVTGKRSYSNMLIERISVTTDEHSEFALMASITCKQVFLVKTQVTDVQSTSSNPADHKEGDKTAPENKKGEANPQPKGEDVGKGVTKENIDPDENAYTDPPPSNPETERVADTATRNSTEQQNVEKTIEMNRPEREVSQGTRDILRDRDQPELKPPTRSIEEFLSSSAGPTRMIGGSSTPVRVGY